MAADRYTHGHHESVLRTHSWRTAENSAAYLIPHLRSGQRLLDVGCGPGTITADLARRVGHVVAIDSAPAALEAARDNLTGLDNVELAVGDVYGLDFEAGSFDVVHAHQLFQHLVDPVAAFAELRRVCRPDGVVAARDGDFPSMTWFPADPGLDQWLAIYLRVARANGAEPAAGRRLKAWARAAGFSRVQASGSLWCFTSPEERAMWGGSWADRILHSSVADQALAGGYATRGDLEAASAGWRRWAESEDGWFAVINGEVLCRP